MAYIPGIDVSRWQADIDWKDVRASGIQFAFIKATEGINAVDPFFKKNWSAAKEAGLLRGAYHFFWPSLDPQQQAQLFLDTVQMDENDLPAALDLEKVETISNTKLVQNVEIWVKEIEKGTGRKPIIYSGPAYLKDRFTLGNAPPPWAKNHLLWIANYLDYKEGAQPFLPKGWSTWHFWQHTSKGRTNGISGDVDLNWFNGTLADLGKLVGLELAESEPATTKAGPAGETTYTLQPNETLQSLAARFNVSVHDLLKANPDLIQPGMTINIPAGGSGGETQAPPPEPQFYTVKAGDSLWAIAQRFNTTVEALVKANQISNADQINVGQVLKIA